MFQNLIIWEDKLRWCDCAVNELSHLCLEATAKVSVPQPSLSVRWYYGCPENFFKACNGSGIFRNRNAGFIQ